MIDPTPFPRDQRDPLPAFDPVPRRKPRHDGWTPARQVAFIEALADTGSVTRAAAQVNMSTESAYFLRRQPGAEGFARAWEAALDMGVLRLKDEAFDRAMHGQLVPVIAGGKLLGYRRCRNDRLIMFVLRHYGARPQTGSFRTAPQEPSPSRTEPATILGTFGGIDLDQQTQDEIIAVLAAGAARARAQMESNDDADDPSIPFVRERRMHLDHPDSVNPWCSPTFLPAGDADKGDECWRALDLPDERDAVVPFPPPTAIDESAQATEECHPALDATAQDKIDRLTRFGQFLSTGRPLDEWTEWTG